MTQLDDVDLRPEESEVFPIAPPPQPGVPKAVLAGLAALLVAVAAGGYWWLRRQPAPPQATPASTPGATLAAPPSAVATPLDLPRLDESDDLVRRLAGALSSDTLLGRWLAGTRLVRTATAAAANIAEGVSPRPHLLAFEPKGGFTVRQRGGGTVIDPAGYARYDTFASAVASLDAGACADAYRQLEPLFELAYRDLGHPEGGFRKVLEQALAQLAQVPAIEADVSVRPVMRARLVYELADPRLEALTPAQKHLLRMGPANVRKVQAKLRELTERLSGA